MMELPILQMICNGLPIQQIIICIWFFWELFGVFIFWTRSNNRLVMASFIDTKQSVNYKL